MFKYFYIFLIFSILILEGLKISVGHGDPTKGKIEDRGRYEVDRYIWAKLPYFNIKMYFQPMAMLKETGHLTDGLLGYILRPLAYIDIYICKIHLHIHY